MLVHTYTNTHQFIHLRDILLFSMAFCITTLSYSQSVYGHNVPLHHERSAPHSLSMDTMYLYIMNAQLLTVCLWTQCTSTSWTLSYTQSVYGHSVPLYSKMVSYTQSVYGHNVPLQYKHSATHSLSMDTMYRYSINTQLHTVCLWTQCTSTV